MRRLGMERGVRRLAWAPVGYTYYCRMSFGPIRRLGWRGMRKLHRR